MTKKNIVKEIYLKLRNILRAIGIPAFWIFHEWVINIYACNKKEPYAALPIPEIHTPVLTAKSITDISEKSVADSFLLRKKGTWNMFFEILTENNKGVIGHAKSLDLKKWVYDGVILKEQFHLSYPYVFKHEDKYFMIPESAEAHAVRLYQAEDFPRKWKFTKTLIKGNYVDSSIFWYANRWWMFTTLFEKNELHLYSSKSLTGKWVIHPKSPIVSVNPRSVRCGGRVVVHDGKIIRYSQAKGKDYGEEVLSYRITKLSLNDYCEELINGPVIRKSGHGWNKHGMHHVDFQKINNRWIVSVDGSRKRLVLRKEY